MSEQVLKQFEKACESLHMKERKEAEQYLQKFQEQVQPYDVCKYILEHTTSDSALFQMSTILKNVIIREGHTLLSAPFKKQLSIYLISYILEFKKLQLSFATLNQLLTCYSILQKQSFTENSNSLVQDHLDIFSKLSQHNISPTQINSTTPTATLQDLYVVMVKKQFAVQMLNNLITEFGTFDERSSRLNMTLEYHERGRDFFQKNMLIHCLIYSLTCLKDFAQFYNPIAQAIASGGGSGTTSSGSGGLSKVEQQLRDYLKYGLNLLLQVLCWNYESNIIYVKQKNAIKKHQVSFQNENYPTKLNIKDPNIMNILLDVQLLHLLRSIYPIVYRFVSLTHPIRQIIIQLCSFTNIPTKKVYLQNLLSTIYSIIFQQGNIDISTSPAPFNYQILQAASSSNGGNSGGGGAGYRGNEYYDVCSAFLRLSLHFSLKDIFVHVNNPFENFFKVLTQLTNYVIYQSKHSMYDEWFSDSVQILFECWSNLLSESNTRKIEDEVAMGGTNSSSFSKEQVGQIHYIISNCAFDIFQNYVQNSLSTVSEDEEEQEEMDYLFHEQLTCLALLARQSMSSSLQIMIRLLSEQFAMLEKLTKQQVVDEEKLEKLWSNLEVIIPICSYMIADEKEGENPQIPLQVLKYQKGLDAQNNNFLIMVQLIIKLIEFYNTCIAGKTMAKMLSMRVTEKLLLFLKRFVCTYLMPDLEQYLSSEVFTTTVGVGIGGIGGGVSATPAGTSVGSVEFNKDLLDSFLSGSSLKSVKFSEFVLNFVLNMVYNLQGHVKIAELSVELLQEMIDNKRVNQSLVSTAAYQKWIMLDEKNYEHLREQNNYVKRKMFKLLIESSLIALPREKQWFEQNIVQKVLVPLLDGFTKDIFLNTKFVQDKQNYRYSSQTMSKITYYLEKCKGLAEVKDFGSTTATYVLETVIVPFFLRNIGGAPGSTSSSSSSSAAATATTTPVKTLFSAVSNDLLEIYPDEDGMFSNVFEFLYLFVQSYHTYLNVNHCQIIYPCIMQAFTLFANFKKTIFSKNVKESMQEIHYETLILIFKIISQITLKNCLDFSENPKEFEAIIPKFLLSAFQVICPLIDFELFQYPNLCKSYFELIHFIMENYPSTTFINSTLQSQFFASLEFAMTKSSQLDHSQDIISLSLQSIQYLFMSIITSSNNNNNMMMPTQQQMSMAMANPHRLFLQHIFALSFLQNNLSISLVDNIASTLFVMLCFNYEAFTQVFDSFLQQQQSSLSHEAFGKLAAPVTAFKQFLASDMAHNTSRVTYTKQLSFKFKDTFSKFLPVMRSLLGKK